MTSFSDDKHFKVTNASQQLGKDTHTVFVFASGFELRSTALVRSLIKSKQKESISLCGFTFSSFKDQSSRQSNDSFLIQSKIDCTELDARNGDEFIEATFNQVKIALIKTGLRVRLIVDYSSMPRNWYCTLMLECMKTKLPIEIEWWYVAGCYPDSTYPCVGYGEFVRFAGAPSTISSRQTHVFGIGFDSIRTYGIWNHLDPQTSICFVASAPDDARILSEIEDCNREILSSSIATRQVNIEEFSSILAYVSEAARQASIEGDVVLVPDGPKPLVLAMSIAPEFVDVPGIFCWHVAHVKPDNYAPMDVKPSESCYSFRLNTLE